MIPLRQILDTFDRAAKDDQFLTLEHPYVYTADSRLHVYSDAERWAVVGEVVGYDPRAGDVDLMVYVCADPRPSRLRSGYWFDILQPADHWGQDVHGWEPEDQEGMEDREPGDGDEQEFGEADDVEDPVDGAGAEEVEGQEDGAEEAEGEEDGAEEAEEETYDGGVVTVRGQKICVPEAAGMVLWDAVRRIVAEHRDLFLATEEELRRFVPADLPEVLTLEEWYQPESLALGEAPSTTFTYRMIAEVAATGDAGRYRPVDPPNSHWSNWPDAGSL